MSVLVSYRNSAQRLWTAQDTILFETDFLGDGIGRRNGDGSDLKVIENQTLANMTVVVESGRAYNHVVVSGENRMERLTNTDRIELAIGSNSSGSNRVDAVIARWKSPDEPNAAADNVCSIEVIPGTGASILSDSYIESQIGASDSFQRLANVTVANGATQIFDASISDTRESVYIPTDALQDLARATETAALRLATPFWLTSVSGTNTITASRTPTLTAYTSGVPYRLKVANTNSSSVTLNIDGVGAKSIKRYTATGGETALVSGDIQQNSIIEVIYDSAADSGSGAFILQTPVANVSSGPGKKIFLGVNDFNTVSAAAKANHNSSSGVRWTQNSFDTTTVEYMISQCRLPDDYAGGNIKFLVHFVIEGSYSGGVVWGLTATALVNGTNLNSVTEGTMGLSSKTGISNSGSYAYVSNASSAFAIGGVAEAGAFVTLELSRVTGDASDTIGGDVEFLGLTIEYDAV